MAYISTNHAPENLLRALTRPFVAFGNLLIAMAEASSLAKDAKRLSEMSDEALAEKGLTREQALRMVFAAHAHL